MPPLTIYRKGMMLVTIPLIVQLAFAWLVADIQAASRIAEERSFHSKEVMKQAQAVLRSLLNAETGTRSYVFTSDPPFAEPYHLGLKMAPVALEKLQNLVSDNPAQGQVAARISQMAKDLLTWQTQLVKLTEAGHGAQAMELVRKGEGKRRMDAIREAIASFLAEEERLDGERENALQEIQPRQRTLLVGGSLAAFMLTGVLAFVFSREIAGRLDVLSQNVRLLSQGQPLRPPPAGQDEISELDADFRRMAAELERSTQALRKSLADVHDLYNRAPCGYHSLDKDGLFVAINDTELAWFGYGREEVVGKKRFSDCLTPEGRANFQIRYEEFKKVGTASSLEFELIRRDGSRFPVLLNASAIVDSQGQYVASRSTLFDITDRKVLEDKLHELNQELEKRVRDRTAELADANGELLQKNQENEMFVYSVSHDLRSPLVNLQGFSKELELSCRELKLLLADERVPADLHKKGIKALDSDMAESIRFIQTGVMRLSSIIDALLNLSRAGRIEYHFQQVDLQGMVRRVVDSLHGTIQQKGAEVVIHDLPPAHADPPSIEQVFANLIANSLNYLDAARPGRIEVGCLPADPGVPYRTYFVRDNGLGIPQDSQEKIFQAFQRMHPKVAKGEGMGLAIVRRVVERHHGRVWVDSTPGKGSTFFVSLSNHGIRASDKERVF